MLKAILFDLDGTLLNTNNLIFNSFCQAFEELLSDRTLSDEEIIDCIGPTLQHIVRKIRKSLLNVIVNIIKIIMMR